MNPNITSVELNYITTNFIAILFFLSDLLMTTYAVINRFLAFRGMLQYRSLNCYYLLIFIFE